MSFIKFAIVACLVVGGLGLASGVLRLVEDDPTGGVRLAPRVSKATLKWYAAKATTAVTKIDVERLKAGVREVVGER